MSVEKCKSGRCPARKNGATLEQECRDILERIGVADAQQFSAGDLIEMANILAERNHLRRQLAVVKLRRKIV